MERLKSLSNDISGDVLKNGNKQLNFRVNNKRRGATPSYTE
jgi:hypothetical protein